MDIRLPYADPSFWRIEGLELMAHEIDGKVEFFKGCPDSWKDVSFENLALSDGMRVNGRRAAGRIEIEKCHE